MNEDFEAPRRMITFPNSHHTSPITYYPQKLILDCLSGNQRAENCPAVRRGLAMVRQIASGHADGGCQATIDPHLFYHYCLAYSTQTLPEGLDRGNSALRDGLTVSLSLLRDEASGIECLHPYMGRVLSSLFERLDDVDQLVYSVLPAAQLFEFLRDVRNELQQKVVGSDLSVRSSIFRNMKIYYTGADVLAIVLSQDPHKIIIINIDQFLMILDTITSRLVVRLTLNISDILQTEALPSWPTVSRIYRWGDNLLSRYGVKAYATIGTFEDIITSVFVNYPGTDPLGLGHKHRQTLLEDAAEIEQEYGISARATEELLEICESISCPNQLSEVFGLRKHWGNPMVDAAASGRAVQDKVDEDLPINPSSLVRLLASFNRMITIEYIKKHGVWPKIQTFNADNSHPLYRSYIKGHTRISETAAGHKHEHWALLRFGPNCVLKSYDNELSLISDKSVSLPRSKLRYVYDKTLLGAEFSHPPPEQRRLILEFLRTNHMPILEIFEIIMTGHIPVEWLANAACMKGGEMKHWTARIFAVLTYELRQYFAVTEEMIKDHIFLYNPHQTMTMKEGDLLSRLREVTTQMDPESHSRFLNVLHIIDFSKWNLRMRYENTVGVFKAIDDFLGTPGLIEASHLIFSDMTNLVQDRYNPPDEDPVGLMSDTVWTLHNRGWEGQRQKGWTVLTSALLSDIERSTGITSLICGQGDNQTLLSKFPVPQEFRNPNDWITERPAEVRLMLDRFYEHLEQECLGVGLKIKTGESCRSLSYFNYGKRLYFGGIELSMTLKRLAKMMTEPNSSYPTTESILKTMTGAENAANLYNHPSIVPILVGNVFNAYQLHAAFFNNPLLSNAGAQALEEARLALNVRTLRILMSIPPCLGGVPTITLTSSLFRGHPDPAAEDFVFLQILATMGDITSRKILNIVEAGTWFDKSRANRDSLILSPFSLNLNLPSSAIRPLINAVTPALKEYCKNSMVQALYSDHLTRDEESIMSALSSMKPFHPLIANDIYSRSISGKRRTFTTGLSNTTSLVRLVSHAGTGDIMAAVETGEYGQLLWWCSQIKDVLQETHTSFNPRFTHDERLQVARDRSWGVQVVGVTTPHPLEQFKLTETNEGCCRSECLRVCREHIVLVLMKEDRIKISHRVPHRPQLERMRTHMPYTGNRVSEGITHKSIVSLNHLDTFHDLTRLNTIRVWVTEPDNNFDRFILDVMRTRSNLSLDIINSATGIPSRVSHNHRAALMATRKSCAPSSTSNMLSCISLSSNLMGEFSHGTDNYSMPFGPAFLAAQHLICLKDVYTLGQNGRLRTIAHFHVRRSEVPTVYDGKVDLDQPPPQLSDVGRGTSLYAQSADVVLQDNSGRFVGLYWSKPDEVSTEIHRMAYAMQLVGNSLINETLFREQIALNVRTNYPTRSGGISISDVSLVTVPLLIRVLAIQFLLILPSQVVYIRARTGFLTAAYEILDRVSDQFWSQFSTPMINPRLLRKLVRLAPAFIHSSSSREVSGLKRLVVTAVICEMYRLREEIIEKGFSGVTASPVVLLVPTPLSLKHMFSRWIELHFLAYCSYLRLPNRESIDHAKDMSANVQSAEIELMEDLMLLIRDQFSARIRLMEPGRNVFVLTPICINTSYPWADLLRNIDGEIEVLEEPDELGRLTLRISPYAVTLNTGTHMVETAVDSCNCGAYNYSPNLRAEHFFMKTGRLSKSHYRFLEVIFSLRLEIRSVMCLGTSTATEACAISRFAESDNIYVNCLNDLRNFSSHSAATYTPAAFLAEGSEHKLWRPTESTLTCNDLLLDECVRSVSRVAQGVRWSGVTCDAELPFDSPFEDKQKLLSNVIRICSNCLEVGGWLIIKVPVICIHQLHSIVTLIGRHFSSVTVSTSIYSGSRQNFMMFTGVGWSRVGELDLSAGSTLCNLTDNAQLANLINFRGLTHTPLAFQVAPEMMAERAALDGVLCSSFETACYEYLPGWMIENYLTERGDVVVSLRWHILALRIFTREALFAENRIQSGGTMPRAAVLSSTEGSTLARVRTMYQRIHRAELLIKLLRMPNFNLQRVERIVEDWLHNRKQYKIRAFTFTITVNAGRFVQFFSRYLYEILGHMYGPNYDLYTGPYMRFGIHLPRNVQLSNKGWPILESIGLRGVISVADDRFLWARRCLVFSVLSVAYQQPGVTIYVSVPRYRLILRQLDQLCNHLDVREHLPTDNVDANLVWLTHMNYSDPIPRNLPNDSYAVLRCNRLTELLGFYRIGNISRLPWSGRVPSFVMVHILQTGPIQHRIQRTYPDLIPSSTSRYTRGAELVGCVCYDCYHESVLTEHFGIVCWQLDRLCSVGRIESVRDIYHGA